MKIIFMGTPDFAVSSLVALADSGEKIIGVVTQPDRPKGRKQLLTPSPVKVTATKYHFPVFQPPKVKDPPFILMIRELHPDLIVVVAFGQILPKALLEAPRQGCINVHASLLPAYRGAAPIQWTIIRGERETGITTILMDTGMDTGPILRSASLPIDPADNGATLSGKLADLGAKTLIDTLEDLKKGRLNPLPQDSRKATYAPMIKKEDGLIRWSEPALLIERKIRALILWPGMYTYLHNRLLKISGAEVRDQLSKGEAGEVVSVEHGKIEVATGKGNLTLTELQPENGKKMTASQFLSGYSLKKGDQLGEKRGR